MVSHRHRSIRSLALLLFALALLFGGLAARAQSGSRHLALGNPSAAVTDPAQPGNYLISRDQYAVGYSRDRGIPTWVSWNLQASDLGTTPRYEGQFFTDTSLPDGWPRITHSDYTGSGYDRGHMTPSADRTASVADNEATFILTNVLPQAPANNQGLWAQLEGYARDLVAQGNELYIISGGAGSLGTLAGGKLTVPATVWKVMLVLPAGENDVVRVTAQTQVIAVWTPNDATVQGKTWQEYQTTARCIEQRTGLDVFSAVEDSVETAIQGAGCISEPPAGEKLFLPLVRAAEAAPATPTPVTPTPVTPTPVTPTPVTPTPVTPTPASVKITSIEFDPPGDDVQGEYVLIRNEGGSSVSMGNWTLRDLANTTFTFPAFTLAAGAEVRVWTKGGVNDAGNLFWGRSQPIWNNSGGDTAILRDAGGNEVSRYSY
jgi:endonuclease G